MWNIKSEFRGKHHINIVEGLEISRSYLKTSNVLELKKLTMDEWVKFLTPVTRIFDYKLLQPNK